MRGQANVSIAGKPLQKALRNRMTDAEQRLWQRLRERQLAGCKFRRQHPFFDYILDFVCLEKSLVIEIDGGQHLESESDRERDRDRRLREAGFRVLRFWSNEVLQQTDAVLEAIWSALAGMQDSSSPFKGEGRRGMGLEAENPAGSLHQQPHPPPSLPLEGGGGGHSEVSA